MKNEKQYLRVLNYLMHITFVLNLIIFSIAFESKLNIIFNLLSLLLIGISEIYCLFAQKNMVNPNIKS